MATKKKRRAPLENPGRVEIKYEPLDSAIAFHNSNCEVKALCGPAGSGKTSAACIEFFMMCHASTVPLRGLVLRESYRQLKDSTLQTWLEWFPEPTFSRYIKSESKIILTCQNEDGRWLEHELHMRHARRAAEASNFLSTEYAWIWLEEVAPAFDVGHGIIGGGLPREIYAMAIMRTRQKNAPSWNILLTFNPPTKHHWAYKEFFAPTADELAANSVGLFRMPAKENAHNLKPGYYDKLEEVLGPEMAQRFVYGEPVTVYAGVRVFPECREDRNVSDKPLEVLPGGLVIGFDFGLTPVALICQITQQGQLRALKELQLWNAGVERLADELAHVLREEPFRGRPVRSWGDPAGNQRQQTDEKTCFGVLATKGFPVAAGAVAFSERKEAVKQRCLRVTADGEPCLLIDRDGCPMLTEGMLGAYRYPQTLSGIVGGSPMKNDYSHVADALQYVATGEFSVYSGVRKASADDEKKPAHYNPFSDKRGVALTTWMGR